MHIYVTQAHLAPPGQGDRHIKLQLPDAFPVGDVIVEMRARAPLTAQPRILTIPRLQAPALPEAACWSVADLGFINPPQWCERAQVETDEALLQPVAYGVLLNGAGHAWCYQRAGGDERVNGRLSCGVGGHVDAQDAQHPTHLPGPPLGAAQPFDAEATLRTAWLRELSEELQLHPEQSTDAMILHHPEAKYFSV